MNTATEKNTEKAKSERLDRAAVRALPDAEKDRLRSEAFSLRAKGKAAAQKAGIADPDSLLLTVPDSVRLADLTRCGMLPADPPPPRPRTRERDAELKEIARQRNAAAIPDPELHRLAVKIQAAGGRDKASKDDVARFDTLMDMPGKGGRFMPAFLNSEAEAERVRGLQVELTAEALAAECAALERILKAAESRDNIFARTGGVFVVSYDGRREYLADGKGLRYIREIISRAGGGMTPLELSATIHSLPPEHLKSADGHEATNTPGTEADWNAIRRADARDARGRICDEYGMTPDQYADGIAELKAGLREAIKAGDIEGAKTHRKALRDLGEGDPKARTGKRLPPDPQAEQARTRVANAIRRAFDDMKAQHPAAAKYFRATVKTRDGRWRYTGEEPFAT
jgi:hypothetical protein